MALRGPNIYPGIAGCSYPNCLPGATVSKVKNDGYAQAQDDLRNLLRKTRDHTPSARVAAVIAWAGENLDQMTGMSRAACRACREDIGPCVCLHDCGATVCTGGFSKKAPGLVKEPCRCGHGTKMHECRSRANGSSCAWCGCPVNNRGTCGYTLDECPYDWCAVHDDLIVEDKYYCTPACIVGHRRQDGRCG